ncbi:MAG: hypothetical protein ACXWAT_00210 [Methylobacter sp.]
MKKILALVLFLVASATAQASGPYDGIWVLSIGGYNSFVSLHENNSQVVAAMLGDGLNEWGAASGARTNNVIDLVSLPGYNPVNGHWVVTVTSAATASVQQLSCAPAISGAYCAVYGAATGTAQKIF